MRDTLADQREEARAQEAAISGAPTGPPELTFIESIFAPVGNALSSVRIFIFGAPAPGARAQAPR
jgi:hypothetical protein